VPDDYNLVLNLARAEFNLRHVDQAREHIERALELGKDKSNAYEQAFICWVIERKFDEAQAVQQRGEAAGKLTADFYIHTGIECLSRAAPEPELPELDFLFGFGRKTAKPARGRGAPRSHELETLGKQLLDQALALGPEVEVLRHIIAEVGPDGADVGLPYAQLGWRWLDYSLSRDAPLPMMFELDPAPDPEPLPITPKSSKAKWEQTV
jgi:hypothetical protein